MELMFLVYAVENLTYGGTFFLTLFWMTFATILTGLLFAGFMSLMEEKNHAKTMWDKLPKRAIIWVCVLLLTLHTILPTRQTAIYMASAYAIQSIITTDKTKELANKGYHALTSQLDKWAKEVPEVGDMLIDAGLTKIKED